MQLRGKTKDWWVLKELQARQLSRAVAIRQCAEEAVVPAVPELPFWV